MSLYTSVLTGGVNNHETTSEEANGVYTDFVNEGVVGTVSNSSGVAPATGGFAVNAQSSPDMTVAVSSGVAYVEGTPSTQNAQTFRVKNTATENVTISSNSSGSTKYDWVYIKLDATKLNGPNTAGTDAATLVTSRSTSSSADDGTPPTYGYAIAVVTVANGAATITNANIRDVRSRVTLDTGATTDTTGWIAPSTTFSTATGYNKGNREFDLTSSADMTGTMSPGMRLKVARGTTPPTQCADLESGSSHYASKTSPSGITFTDDYTMEAWVNLESYTGSSQFIIGRQNASTEGFSMYISSTGNLIANGLRIAANNRTIVSYRAVPTGRWVHVAATMDHSANTHTMYIDGESVAFATTTNGTITAIVQGTTALSMGAQATPANYLDGKLADVRIWNAVRTATQIRDNMHQQLVGNETNLVAYYKLDGNFNDSTSNSNNMTGQNGAVATNADNPMNSTEYAIITKVTASTVTVFTGTDYNIPNMTLSTPYYSTQKTPFGFPSQRNKWIIEALSSTTSAVTLGNKVDGLDLAYPTGEWVATGRVAAQVSRASGSGIFTALAISSSATDFSDPKAVAVLYGTASAQPFGQGFAPLHNVCISVTSQTTHYVVAGGSASITITPTTAMTGGILTAYQHRHAAECAYL